LVKKRFDDYGSSVGGGEGRHQLFGIIEVIAPGIQVGIADPVIEILDGFLIAPE